MGADTDRHFIERLTLGRGRAAHADGAAAILPIGAAAKQHGFHLPMNTDRIQAEWLAARLADRIDALIWPTVTYGYYPAFAEYAGSSSLSASTFEAMVHEIASRHPRLRLPQAVRARYRHQHAGAGRSRAGASRCRPCAASADSRGPALSPRRRTSWPQQSHGSHADELETSLMLALAPDLVDMSRAEASPAVKHEAPGPPDADRTRPRRITAAPAATAIRRWRHGQGRNPARRHARRSQRTGRRFPGGQHRPRSSPQAQACRDEEHQGAFAGSWPRP